MRCLLTIIAFVLVTQTKAEEPFSVTNIPQPLLKSAYVVKRLDDQQFILQKDGEAVIRIHCAYTIMHENGDDYATFSEYYNKFREIRSVEGTLYDARGNVIRRMKKKDLQDLSAVNDINLIDDNRMKRFQFYHRSYPYTVEFEYEIKLNGTMFYPPWFPQSDERVSVQQSRFIFSCPDNQTFRYKAYQYEKEPVVVAEKGTKVYTWELNNCPAFLREPYAPAARRLTPIVLFGPVNFEMQNYRGTMQSWQDLGKFIYALKAGRDELPGNVKDRVHQLTDNIDTPQEKVRLLYEYMQQHTRYISIQLGIGGWQPFEAKYVADKKYGDCKALSNYMAALLKEAGIPSLYTVINAGRGRDELFEEFPSSQFNHAILCVPLQKDTMWLECTSQTTPAGYMGSFTGNRYALVVDENGGKLVRTPLYTIEDNTQSRNIKARLDQEATLQINAATLYTGIEQEEASGLIHHLSPQKVKEQLQQELDFPTFEVDQFSYQEHKGRIPAVQENLQITVSNYATITGKRLFILPNVMSRFYRKPLPDPTRKYQVELNTPSRYIDTVEIDIPVGYSIESAPKDTEIKTPFGLYRNKVVLKDNRLYYYRLQEQYTGTFPAGSYAGLVKFYGDIYTADRARVVLVKAETPLKAF
ncbi:MAG: hypothetical protein ABS85_04895 [Sphingobacteriales bacterium SCN 48-20]|uniref:DUF3857 domain-containing transglutaminase family protein n=1 Tax=Terrimonas ferruginea TaxID=249 RepID=UPI00086DF1E4|nr:DUF3857 and transglutaminase domain-containing protein [Terrimonas ferruginea]MBN8781835.1 DUF3857 and transglutaminase domain-containing protein [Terrimonas ferruginea]ODT93855.1 MAG: hypothetical protein ABS85_04895 [Sphingobacteriales bacterium SCN 48-20]OJW44979.1 MAG: hypothetical protein BGO56_16165 [Sphingobacteriales bacterium 48-107]